MKKKLIEILFVVVLLFVPAFIAGCKDEPTVAKELHHEQEVELVELNLNADGAAKSDPDFEPNEPECKHDGNALSNTICACYHTDGSYCWVCPDCGEYINSGGFEPIKDYGFALPFMPPEIETTITKGQKLDINRLIPTWPQYIELEKNLVLDANDYVFPYVEYDGHHVSQGAANVMVIPKGTKIYFK